MEWSAANTAAAFVLRRGAALTRGVSLIEVMVVIAIVAIGVSLAAPSMGQLLANYRIRSAADSIVTGLSYARAEAVRRNSPVTFTLNAAGTGWQIDQVTPAQTLQTRPNAESSGVTSTVSTASRVVRFTPVGMVDTSAPARLERVTLSAAAAGSESRQIDIFGGGLIRICNPAVSLADDPRRC